MTSSTESADMATPIPEDKSSEFPTVPEACLTSSSPPSVTEQSPQELEGVVGTGSLPPAAALIDDSPDPSIPPPGDVCPVNDSRMRRESSTPAMRPPPIGVSEITRLLGEHLVEMMAGGMTSDSMVYPRLWEHLSYLEIQLEAQEILTELIDFLLEAEMSEDEDMEWPEELESRAIGLMYMCTYLEPAYDWLRVRMAVRACCKAIERL